MKNPFEVLNITPAILRELSEQDIRNLTKANYHALQRIFHEDRGGSKKRSVEINQAYEMLEDPELFERFRKKHCSRAKKTREQTFETDNINKSITSYLKYLHNGLTILNCKGIELQIYDVLAASKAGISTHFPSKDSLRRKFNYELYVNAQGIEKKFGDKVYKYPNRYLVGSISSSIINYFGGIKEIVRYMFIQAYGNPQKKTSIPGRVPSQSYLKNFDENVFSVIAPYLSPKLQKESFLFSYSNPEDKSYFTLEGRIISMTSE